MRQTFYDPGALNHLFQLEQIVETPDGCGGTDVSWLTVSQVWGRLIPRRVRTSEIAQQQTEHLLHDVVLRFREDIKSGWQLRMDERVFKIDTVHDPDERRRYLICSTKEEGR